MIHFQAPIQPWAIRGRPKALPRLLGREVVHPRPVIVQIHSKAAQAEQEKTSDFTLSASQVFTRGVEQSIRNGHAPLSVKDRKKNASAAFTAPANKGEVVYAQEEKHGESSV